MNRCLTLSLLLLAALFNVKGQPLSGVYTIGGVGADYQTISAAATHLGASGINGPVVFNIAPGTYIENVVIGPVQGTSAANTITFQSTTTDSTDVIITHPSGTTSLDNYVVRFNGASYTSLRYVTLMRNDTNAYSQVVDIMNGSHHINLYHNRIIGTQANSSATFKSLLYAPNQSSMSNIVLDGNRFENGSYGAYLIGIGALICCIDQGNMVINNHFVNQYHAAIMLSYQWGPLIENNIIESSSPANGFGLYTFYADNGLRITKNRVSLVNGKGIYVHNTNLAGLPVNLIANNFVAVGGTSAADGIMLDNSRWCNVLFNSVHIYNSSTGSSAFKVNGILAEYNELYNNVLANSGGGFSAYVAGNTVNPLISGNYNNFFVTGSFTGFWQSAGNQATLVDYRTSSGMEQQSVAINPMFVSNTDLHSRSPHMNNLGSVSYPTSTPAITHDIDGDLRCNVTPDIGADEYSAGDLEILAVDTLYSLCEGGEPAIKVTVVNTLPYDFNDTLNIYYQFGSLPVDTYWCHLSIPPDDTIVVYLSGNSKIPVAGSYTLKIFHDYYWDIDRSNDTISVNVTVSAPLIVDLGGDFILCTNESRILAAPGNFTSYRWHDNSTDSTWLANGVQMIPGIHTVWLIAKDFHQCTGTDSIMVTVHPHPEPVITIDPSFTGVIAGDTVTVICSKLFTIIRCGQFNSYLWSNSTSDSVIQIMPDTYSIGMYQIDVTVTNDYNCQGIDSIRFYVDECESVEELIQEVCYRIYPNPSATGIFNIEFYEGTPVKFLRIFNTTGRTVGEIVLVSDIERSITIDISGFPKGIYLLQMLSGERYITEKLILR